MGLDDVKNALRTKFGDKISQSEFATTSGDRGKLVKLVAEKTGVSEDEAKKQVDEIFAANT